MLTAPGTALVKFSGRGLRYRRIMQIGHNPCGRVPRYAYTPYTDNGSISTVRNFNTDTSVSITVLGLSIYRDPCLWNSPMAAKMN
ncbi:hypothetical protein PENSUB_8580 [Penicillium subrubescens]|uniref:Uncharacterized protein n=1 Tax=Penicillium subrubescens TaxID=1316194 RepID=A0A1Q5TG31_9EURO|nr:hypothetical protein PENSUB_8580 [Penicillium subrubescens]